MAQHSAVPGRQRRQIPRYCGEFRCRIGGSAGGTVLTMEVLYQLS